MYDSELIRRFHEAVLSAYDTQSLERMVRFRLDKKLDHYVSGDDFRDTVFDLIDSAESEGWFEQLVQAAHEALPGNNALRTSVIEINAANANNPSIPQLVLQPKPEIRPNDNLPSIDDGQTPTILQRLPQLSPAVWSAFGIAALVIIVLIARRLIPPTPPIVDETPKAEPVQAGSIGGGGALLAFQSQSSGQPWNIFTADLNGRNRKQLTDDGSNNNRPRWSPDGKTIAFRTDRAGNEDIWLMDADGSNPRPFIDSNRDEHPTGWSPDGSYFTYHADAGDGVASLFIYSFEDETSRRFTDQSEGNNFWADWSADGTRLAYWSTRNDARPPELFARNLDGSGETSLLPDTALDPFWSPVRDEIVFYGFDSNGRAKLQRVDPRSGTTSQIDTGHPGNHIFSGWSPDGEWLLFNTDFHGADELYRVRQDGSEATRLTKTASADQHAVWQPNGRTVLAVEGNNDLVVWHSYTAGDEARAVIEAVSEELADAPTALNITLKRVNRDAIVRTFQASVAAGTAPDIVLGDSTWGGQLVDDEQVRDPSLLVSAETANRLHENALNHLQYGGQLIGYPYTMRGIIPIRNRTLIPTAPATITDIFALDASLYNLERGLFYSGGALHAMGGRLMDDAGNPTFATEDGELWLDLIAEFNDPVSYSDDDLIAFEQREAGLIIDGNWNIGRLAGAIGRENLVIDPWPVGLSGWVQYDVAYVSAELPAEKKAAVGTLLEALLSAETQTEFANNGQIPVVTNAKINNPLVGEARKVLASGESFPLNPAMEFYWEPLTDAINAVYDGKSTATQALESAERRIKANLP